MEGYKISEESFLMLLKSIHHLISAVEAMNERISLLATVILDENDIRPTPTNHSH